MLPLDNSDFEHALQYTISWHVINRPSVAILIGGVAEFLYTTQPTDSLFEDTVGLPETNYFFQEEGLED